MKRARSAVLRGLGLWGLLVPLLAGAEPVRVLPEGTLPDDRRLGPLKTLNDDFPFAPPATREAWQERSEGLRRQVLVSQGLWPMPRRTPHNAKVYGRVERDAYTVERVTLESYPGHFVTGSLYRPKGRSGPRPAVLCPHGHWKDGRFYDAGEKAIRKQLAEGAERFELAGRYPLQARCVQLARMGCLVFHYDMVGYADSVQLAHREGQREAMNTPENWGYFSPQAELRLETIMGLQTYNSLSALDWVASLPEADGQRIAVTGASGGGTQTFMLGAVEPRVAVAVPAVMVSTAMQGGCTCENACYLRVGTGNVELAGLVAPRPLGLIGADDWTKEIMTKGLPELHQLYKLLGAPDRVMAKALVHFPHNYNYVSRAVMYGFLNRHLKLGQEEPIVEEDFRPLSVEEMSVWDADHARPASGDDYERSLLRWITADSQSQMEALVPRDAASLAEYRRVVGGAVDVMIGRGVAPAGAVTAKIDRATDRGTWRARGLLLGNAAEGEEVPAVLMEPKSWNRDVVVWVSREGKRSLCDARGEPSAAAARLLAAGTAVLGLDLIGQGEFTSDGRPVAKARLNRSGRGQWESYAGYTYGYNWPLFSQRTHDVLSAVSFARGALKARRVHLAGLAGAGPWVLAARAQAGEAVDRVAADTAGFRFARLTAIDDPDFLPGGAKYLDLPGMAALCAPGALWLAGEGAQAPDVVAAAYQAAGKTQALTVYVGAEPDRAAAEWLGAKETR